MKQSTVLKSLAQSLSSKSGPVDRQHPKSITHTVLQHSYAEIDTPKIRDEGQALAGVLTEHSQHVKQAAISGLLHR